MKKTYRIALAALAAAVLAAGCAALPGSADIDRRTAEVVHSSFRAEGPVQLDRLVQDETNKECSAADVAGQPLPAERAKAIEALNMKQVSWPSDGRFLGDWKRGEDIAQNGRGLTWIDDAKVPNGGNCYNCHQISKQEIAFGTLGPSLYQYGKLRGVSDPASPQARAIVEYTWGKIWNAKAYNACSLMPRFGHGILSEQQVKDVMALLLDPQSPVNQ